MIKNFFSGRDLELKIFVVLCVLISFIFEIFQLFTQLPFSYDQARDAFEAYAIWHDKDIKIQGPSTDIPGLHHGVLWYYILALLYFLTQGNPQYVALFFFSLSFAMVPLTGVIAYKLFNDRRIGLIATACLSFSPIFLSYTRWMSNPLIAIYVVPILLYFIWEYVHKRKAAILLIIGICMGILIQSNLAHIIFLTLLPIYLLYFKIKPSWKDLFYFLGGVVPVISTFILVEIRFQGKGITSLWSFLSKHSTSSSALSTLFEIIDKFIELIAITILPISRILLLFLVGYLFYKIVRYFYSRDKRVIVFLSIWLLNIIIFVILKSGILHHGHVFGPSIFPAVLLSSYAISRIIKNERVLIAMLLIFFSISMLSLISWREKHYNPLVVQLGMNYYDQIKAVEYTYNQSNKLPFTLITITNPLDINTTWAYLYESYGQKKYGYIPFWHGKGQKGYLGNLPEKPFATNERFLIMEPTEGIYEIVVEKLLYEEDMLSDILEEKKFGNIIVQKRIFHPEKLIATPSSLLNNPILND